MKKKYVIVLAVLVMVLAACSNPTGGGDGTYVAPNTPPQTDSNPSLTVPASAADIPALDADITYSADQNEATKLVEDALEEIQNMIFSDMPGLGALPSKTDGARAIQNETFEYYLSQDAQADIEQEIPGAKVYGYAKGNVSYDDDNFVPFKLTADAKARFELPNGYVYGGYNIKGYFAGTANAKNIYITDKSASGTASANLDYAVSIAHVTDKIGVKCRVEMKMTLNASSNAATYKYKVIVFAQNGSDWFNYNESASVNISDFFNY
jgi:hypothetical protein